MEVESTSPVLVLLGPISVTESPSVGLRALLVDWVSELSVSGVSYALVVAGVATAELGWVGYPAAVEAAAVYG